MLEGNRFGPHHVRQDSARRGPEADGVRRLQHRGRVRQGQGEGPPPGLRDRQRVQVQGPSPIVGQLAITAHDGNGGLALEALVVDTARFNKEGRAGWDPCAAWSGQRRPEARHDRC